MSTNSRNRAIEKTALEAFCKSISDLVGWNNVSLETDKENDTREIKLNTTGGAFKIAGIMINDVGDDWCASFILNITTGILQETGGLDFILTEDGCFIIQE